jgi:hypothetical protein
VFHMNVAKVDRDVAMAIHICYKRMFQMFHLFQVYVASVFIWMLQMFHTYVTSVLSRCCICFAMTFQVFLHVFQTHISSVFICLLSVFRHMLQMFHLDVSKVDQMLHIL